METDHHYEENERLDFEGTIADKRVGWDNRESYVELKECLRLNRDGEIVEVVGKKQLYDAFIEEVEVVEKTERRLSAELRATQQAKAKAKKGPPGAAPVQPKGEGSDSDDGPVSGMLPGLMFGMGPMGMGMMPMGGLCGMPVGMGFMPMPVAHPPVHKAMPMAMPGMAMPGMPMGCPAVPATCAQAAGTAPEAKERSRRPKDSLALRPLLFVSRPKSWCLALSWAWTSEPFHPLEQKTADGASTFGKLRESRRCCKGGQQNL
ncbi:unnamed protein product, partial [Symbiodinium necroappetens]